MKYRLIGSFVCLFLMLMSSTAQGWVSSIKISPKHPLVDESEIIISWRTDRTLKSGYHYEGLLLGAGGRNAGCANFVLSTSKRRPKKHSKMSLTFSSRFSLKTSPELIPGGDPSNPENYTPGNNGEEGYSEWCNGKASISISIAKNGAKEGSGAIIGATTIRFYKKP